MRPSPKIWLSTSTACCNDRDVEALDAFLDPAFQEARANGTTANKQQYLATTPDVGAYRLSDFHVTRAGDALIARYTFDGRELIDQQLYLSDPGSD